MRSLLLVLAACGGSSSSQPQLLNTGQRGPITPARLLTAEDLARAGHVLTKVSDTETLVCPPDNSTECICLAELPCRGNACMTLAKNLEVFRAALARDYQIVSCELADTGRSCDLSYFRFVGDIHRSEVRYFGADGHLIAQTNSTDYPAYCEGQSFWQVTGRVPDCTMQTRDVEVICADAGYRERAGKLVNPRSLFEPG